MARPRGRRTQQVAVYLTPAEAAAWDALREIQAGAGFAGLDPVSRGTWVAERVIRELDPLTQAPRAHDADRAEQALQALDQEAVRLGPPDWERSHGRVRARPRP